jgi:hypothetical protein
MTKVDELTRLLTKVVIGSEEPTLTEDKEVFSMFEPLEAM